MSIVEKFLETKGHTPTAEARLLAPVRKGFLMEFFMKGHLAIYPIYMDLQ